MFKGKRKNELLAVLFIIASGIAFYLLFDKMAIISTGKGKASEVDLMNELYKYECSLEEINEENVLIKHYVSDEKCPFEIEFLEHVSYDSTFNYYVNKVNDNGNGNKEVNTYSINGSMVSIESTGVKYYKHASYKNNTILYLSTIKSFSDNAKSIRNNLGFKYDLNINFEYFLIPVVLFVVGIILVIIPTGRKKAKGRK